MKASDLPTIKLPIPFANSAVAPYIHEVPVDSQIGITDGAASLTTGFVPDNFAAPGAGGVPPFGNDVNGILFEISGWTRWMNAGGAVFPYDASFAIDISGYPKGAMCSGTAGGTTFYISVVDDNLVDPTSAPGASWQVFGLGNSGVTAGAYAQANITVGPDGRVTAAASGTLPTRTVLTSGSGTYATKAGCRQLRIRMIAGGGGGCGTTVGTIGGVTSFNSITCAGGNPATDRNGAAVATGGTGTASLRFPGGAGESGVFLTTGSGSNMTFPGGRGGSGPFGGGGASDSAGAANTGAGGGGKTVTAIGTFSQSAFGGASAGEYAEIIISNPSGNYSYAVGAGGAAGTGAGAGAAGIIIIDEFY